MTPSYHAPKGTRDLTGPEARAFSELERIARSVFSLHHFEEIRTPIFESSELFSRSLGQTSDVVEKEMFTFTDRGERAFSLRPEGTAGVVRHYVENSLWTKSGAHRFFYCGPMFRAERPQAGRFRQFWQIGSEHFGASDPASDANTVIMAWDILTAAGLKKLDVHVNSLGCATCRTAHRATLVAYLKSKESDLTEESRKRMQTNPLRVLDSKADGPKLKDAPAITDFLCDACRAHHDAFLNLLSSSGLAPVQNPRLVRGLDYYSRSVFEFVVPDLGAQSAVAAGGRYDDLVPLVGGPATPAVGFALGMDRVVMASQTLSTAPANAAKSVLIIPMENAAVSTAFELANQLRQAGIAVPPVSANKKMKNQLASASEQGLGWAAIIGEDELKLGTVALKNLATREQRPVPRDQLLNIISSQEK